MELKSNYQVEKSFEAFYSGGPVSTNKDGSTLFVTCGNVVNVLNSLNGVKIASIGDETDDDVTCFVLHPNDAFIVIAYKNLLLKQWSIIKAEEKLENVEISPVPMPRDYAHILRSWKSFHRGSIARMCFSSDGRLLATGGSDSVVKIWDLEQKYCVFTLRGATGVVGSILFEPPISVAGVKKSDRFFYAGDDGKIFCWNLTENRLFNTAELHTSAVTSILIGDQYVFTAGRDSIIGVWHRRTMILKKTIPVFDALETLLICFENADEKNDIFDKEKGPFLIGGGEKGVVSIWNVENGKRLICSSDFGSTVKQIFGCRNEKFSCYAAVTEDHIIRFLDPRNLTVRKHFVGFNDEILGAAFLEPPRLAVVSNSKDVRLYDGDSGDCQLLSGHKDIVLSVDCAPWNRRIFATCSKDNTIRGWKILDDDVKKNDAVCIFTATGHANNVTGVRFSRLKPAFLASVSDDTTLKIWKLPPNLSTVEKEENFAPKILSAMSTVAAHDKGVTCVDSAPNDRLIATGSMDKLVKIWKIAASTSHATLAGTISGHRRGVWDVCFSPVDQVVASASGDWTVKIFALEDFSCVKTFEGHQTTVVRSKFLKNGFQLASTDSSGLVKLWNIKNGECVKTFDEHSKTVWALTFDENDSKMLTGGADSKLHLWKDATSEDQNRELEKRARAVADDQKLSNLLNQKQYSKALKMAIRLNRPFNALKIIKEMLFEDKNEKEEDEEKIGIKKEKKLLSDTLRFLSSEQLEILLSWIVDWNTNSRNCHVAQTVLAIVLRQNSPEKLLKLTNIKSVVESLLPYSERHFERLGRLRQQAAFAGYTWQQMRLTGREDSNAAVAAIKNELAEI